MKQFSLDEYLKNPNRKIVTGKGNPVRIICTNANSAYCVIGLVCLPNKEEVAVSYYANGTRWSESKSEPDLFFVTEKKEGWINIYSSDYDGTSVLGENIFETKEEADKENFEEVYSIHANFLHRYTEWDVWVLIQKKEIE